MAELDAFETRFAAAYRRYLDEAPTAVNAAAVARTVAAHPRARWAGRAWPLRAAPAFAWLALVALVIGALIMAVLFAGSQRPALVGIACPAGTNPNAPGPGDQERPPSDFDGMVFDRDSAKIVVTADGETWAFDVCTNTWAERRATPFGMASPRLVHDVDSDVTLAVDGDGRVWAYDLEADTWAPKSAAAWPPVGWVRLAYVPDSGRVLALVPSDPLELWTYDIDADAWDRIAANATASPDEWDIRFMAYDASVRRIIAYDSNDCADCEGGDRTTILDLSTGTWSPAAGTTPDVYRDYYEPDGEIAYDESAQRIAVFGLSDDRIGVIAYDATADRWETLFSSDPALATRFTEGPEAGPYARFHQWMVYDSLNERLVLAGGMWSGGGPAADDVLAFDTTTRRWSQLLASVWRAPWTPSSP